MKTVKRYAVRVTLVERLHIEPFNLDGHLFRWRWLAHLRLVHFLNDDLLRSTTTNIEVIEVDVPRRRRWFDPLDKVTLPYVVIAVGVCLAFYGGWLTGLKLQ